MSIQLCIVGDDLVAGVGDPRGLGWVGRVLARTQTQEPLATYSLAVPEETSTLLAARWESECNRRFTGSDDRLVIGLGTADLTHGVSVARSRLNLANILDDATNRRIPSFVVGPPPRADIDESKVRELSQAYADVCQRRRVTYAETFEPLRNHQQWLSDAAAGDGIHPGQAGYGLLAWLVLHHGWHTWIGGEDPAAQH